MRQHCVSPTHQSQGLGRGLGERTLEDLEVLDIGIFRVDVELDARHGHVEEDAVVDLAESGTVGGSTVSLGDSLRSCGGGAKNLPRSALLDFGDVELQKAVEPLHEFLSVGKTSVSSRPDSSLHRDTSERPPRK